MLDPLARPGAIAALKRHYLFSPLSEEEMAQLIGGVQLQQLDAEALLFRQAEAAERFFLVTDGQIKLFHTAADGQEKVVELVNPGQTIAEAVLFMRRQGYPVSAQAVRPVRVLAINAATYITLLQHNSTACMHILGDLSMRLHARLNDVVNLTQQNATFRVVRYLLKQLPRHAENGATIYLDTPKQVIASLLSVKPETFSRVFSRLSQQNIIRVKGREIQILDIERLHGFE